MFTGKVKNRALKHTKRASINLNDWDNEHCWWGLMDTEEFTKRFLVMFGVIFINAVPRIARWWVTWVSNLGLNG